MHTAQSPSTQVADSTARSSRHLTQLGGMTSWGDCLVALRYLLYQRDLIHGSEVKRFETAVASLIGTRFAFSFSSGRVGLHGLLTSLGISCGDEVLVQAPTHIVVANAIRYLGARPIYVDCRPDTFNMDPDRAESLISPRSKVLLLQHTFGIPTDMDWALAFADRHGLIVIEDCVHAMGSAFDGRLLGQFGRAAFFSTEETKMISTTMGGMAVTDDEDLAHLLERYQSGCDWPSRAITSKYLTKLIVYHLITHPYIHRFSRKAYETFGRWNPLPRPTERAELRGEKPERYAERLSNAQAVLGRRQIERFDENIAHRKRISAIYTDYLSERGLATPRPPAKADTAFVRYPVWVTDRKAAMAAASRRVTLGNWFTSVLEESESPVYGDYVPGSCPVAEDAAQCLVNLPTHPRVTEADARTIVSLVAPFVRPSAR